MPLRDHFRPPLDNIRSWDELHGQWPAVIVQHLVDKLPPGFVAAPRVHLGTLAEIDVAAFTDVEAFSTHSPDDNGGVATAVWAPPVPSVDVETAFPDFDEYEVRIYDARHDRRLVAAIEIVSPANKDRLDSRNFFIAKCAGLLQQGVAVSIVDLVTVRQFNLYAETLAFVGQTDPTLSSQMPHIYAASFRWVAREKRSVLQAWSSVLNVGRPLPTLPLWLSASIVVPLDLEQSYEKACRDLRIA